MLWGIITRLPSCFLSICLDNDIEFSELTTTTTVAHNEMRYDEALTKETCVCETQKDDSRCEQRSEVVILTLRGMLKRRLNRCDVGIP